MPNNYMGTIPLCHPMHSKLLALAYNYVTNDKEIATYKDLIFYVVLSLCFPSSLCASSWSKISTLIFCVFFKFGSLTFALFMNYPCMFLSSLSTIIEHCLWTTFCKLPFVFQTSTCEVEIRSCLALCSCSYSLLLKVIKFHCFSSLLCSSSPSNLYKEPRILIRNPKPFCWNPFFLFVDMSPLIQTSSQLQVPPLVPRSRSIIPNLYQFKAKVECPIFVVNPPPTLHVSLVTLKSKIVMVFWWHTHTWTNLCKCFIRF